VNRGDRARDFAEAAERHLDDVHAYLVYLTGDRDHFRAEERRRRREGRYVLAEARAGEAVFGEGLSPTLEQALARLSAAEREVVALRVVLELDGEGAARVLGISTSACSTRLSRALQKLEKEVSAGVAA
jgi:DNA-directed RNA polymerase specialized sigma24 family protein